ncbi:MAG TPA: G1 family glutamic endopeptidase [Solirubrobacteraceae bacterium]|nr:G1 family glutamic endopeptidase [Solirubrobacteraceae bacterium]
MIPALACLAFAAPAFAATQEGASENWAGYVVTSNDDSGFSAVSGQWTESKVACTANSQPSYSAYWVGLGGGGESSSALEQIGTQADCSSAGKATYYAWYELVPSAPVKLALTIRPGDNIWARTAVNGDRVSLYITDRSSHQTWSRTLTMTSASPDTSTAEWVAEAPSECAAGATSECTPLPLADFGKASFTDAYTTSAGHTGSISDSNWTAEAIELEPSSNDQFGGGPGGYFQGGYGSYSTYSSYRTSSDGGAAPTALSDGGTKFSVKYGASLQTSTATGEPQGESNSYGYGSGGYGNGYGDYGYGGYGDYGYGGYSDGGYGSSYGYYGGWGY